MKILYTNFHPRNGGGHANYIANLARSFQGEHQIAVASPSTSRLYAMASDIPGVQCLDVTFNTRPAAMSAEVLTLRLLLRDGQFDLIHVNGSADHRQAMLARVGLRNRPRIIWTKHNTVPIRSMGNYIRAQMGTDGAIGVSDFVSSLLLDSSFSRCPIRTIHHGVDTNRFRPVTAARAQALRQQFMGDLPADTLVLASVGGTDRDKGWIYLAQAIAKLPISLRARVRLLVAGDPLRGQLQQDFSRLGVGTSVVFPGLVERPELVLAAADIGFVLSLHEAFSFAAAESLSTGLPTLVSNAGGLPEVVRDGVDGWVVPAGNVDAVHAWLRQRLSEPISSVMSQAARKHAEKSFSLRGFSQRTMDFYQQICHTNPRSSY
ncbi:glycosyltransferase family 4 protein [Castellaniella sp.]|uniref:glycosyltransferase family 4 protein n=1 Tax=Castellaniella sp. TaxID=1955812 RepID=UPI002AFF7479|nr:glycosyltransferase family 4 protein [Castellaniella sp.]